MEHGGARRNVHKILIFAFSNELQYFVDFMLFSVCIKSVIK